MRTTTTMPLHALSSLICERSQNSEIAAIIQLPISRVSSQNAGGDEFL